MIRIVFLLVTEVAALAAMWALRMDLPWTDLPALAAMPEEVVAAGIVRGAAIGIVGWLLISTLLYLAATPLPWLRRAIGRITAPLVRRVVDTALAATLSMSVASPAVAAEAPPEPIVVTVDEGSAGLVIVPPGMAVAQSLPPDSPPSPSGSASEATVRPTIMPSRPAPTEAALFTARMASQVNPITTYQVQRGDHLWSIAEDVLKQRTGRAIVPDHEIAPFWRSLIDTNKDSLRSGNPDLIYPGEMLTIPEEPS